MNRIRQLTIAALVLGTAIVSASSASANPFLDWLFTPTEPPAYYSPTRYIAPTVAKLNDDIHGPRISVYAPNRHPEIPPTVTSLPASRAHPTLLPVESLIPVAEAPATSRAR